MPPAGAPSRDSAKRLVFRRRHRLSHNRQYQAVYGAKVRKSRGPLVVFAAPNELGHCRLGLSVSRAVGTAVVRNRIKRLLREAFRLDHQSWLPGSDQPEPRGYDLVVTVRPHPPAELETYRDAMAGLVAELDREWRRRARRASGSSGEPNQPEAP